MNLFGLYIRGDSVFHRLGAGPKCVIMLALTLPAAVLRDWRLGVVCLAIALTLLAACRTGLARAWRLPAMVWVLVAMLLGYHLLSGTPGRGVNAVAVFLTAIYVSRLLTTTTPGGDLVVRQAAMARGREHHLFSLVTPVVVRAVGHAQATGAALAARGLGDGEERP